MRQLPRNVVTSLEQGRRGEAAAARRLGMRLHPASGSGRTKADMSDAEAVIEWKVVDTAQSHSVKLSTLLATLREAEIRDKDAYYVIDFGDIVLEGRIHRK